MLLRILTILVLGICSPGSAPAEDMFDIPDPKTGGRGGEIYATVCAACHDQGVNRAPQRRMLSQMSARSVYKALTTGVMKAEAQPLSGSDKIAVAEFVTRRKLGDAKGMPEPPQCRGVAAAFDFGEPPPFAGWGVSPANTRLISRKDAAIDTSNVGRLRVAWALGFPDALRVRSEPGLAGGALYVGSDNGTLYALDRKTGCLRWTFEAAAEIRTGIVVSPWQAGDRTAHPLVYFGDIVGNVYAADAETGARVWQDHPDPHPNATITGTPTLYQGVLYVPVSSLEEARPNDPAYACCTFRGSVVAYDAGTGHRKWQAFTIPEKPAEVGRNAAGTPVLAPSGAAVWNSPAIDAKRGQLYIGTSDSYSAPAAGTSDAVIAVDLATGAMRWTYQALAGDAWNGACWKGRQAGCPEKSGADFDFGAAPMLVHTSGGRDLVVAGQKSGVVHAIDPGSGKLIWKTTLGRGGVRGGVEFGMAASGDAILVPINDADAGETYAEPAKPGLTALDATTGRILWQSPADPESCRGRHICGPGLDQAITATPDLVFAGSQDGWVRIFDAGNGRALWRWDTTQETPTVDGGKAAGGGMGGGAGPVAYRGMLFVSSGYGFAGQRPGNLLLAFTAD
jgi:polyvinyl alcohol dehydrogenase (cytochrome)